MTRSRSESMTSFLAPRTLRLLLSFMRLCGLKMPLIGCVYVNINDIFHLPSMTDAKINNSATNTVTL
ncbi:hypothetical protein PVK06_009868 [Gossypium arboreum]|uniref:Uncharacterized protein n=1 Tax=Gossypium arboreum TaxID=29729 RepID=A0ABR0QNQ0_GOSAR|nr:hypothetical protein PVK06_009868 [Gossypium arboreum]